MIAPELKTPENLRRVEKDIYRTGYVISKGAIGYLVGRTTIDFPAQCIFVSLCERYEFDLTDLVGINDFLKQV